MKILKILKISIMQSKTTKYRKSKTNKNNKTNTLTYKKAISRNTAERTETLKQSNRCENSCSLVPRQEKTKVFEGNRKLEQPRKDTKTTRKDEMTPLTLRTFNQIMS